MNYDFSKRTKYRLVVGTAWSCISARRKELEKTPYCKKRAREREKARKSGEALPPPPVLLCQSKGATLDKVYLLALREAGVSSKMPTISRAALSAHLCKHGVPKKKKAARRTPKVFESYTKELRLTTTQAGLATTCNHVPRTLQRHLNDLEAVALVKFREKLPQGKHPTPSFRLVLDASFLDWQEVAVFANGTTVADGTGEADQPADQPSAAALAAALSAARSGSPSPPGTRPQPQKNGLPTTPGKY